MKTISSSWKGRFCFNASGRIDRARCNFRRHLFVLQNGLNVRRDSTLGDGNSVSSVNVQFSLVHFPKTKMQFSRSNLLTRLWKTISVLLWNSLIDFGIFWVQHVWENCIFHFWKCTNLNCPLTRGSFHASSTTYRFYQNLSASQVVHWTNFNY